MMESIKKLNLGCGEFKKEGYINVDYYSVSKPDVRHNLNKFPYPFKDSRFELIEADAVLEHLNNPFNVMKEIHRICKNKAIVIIRVPHFSRGFTHAEHRRGFDITFPLYFNPEFKGGFKKIEFSLKKMRLHWYSQPELKRSVLSKSYCFFGDTLGKIIDFFANLSPIICSRIWCFWVGGFEEIEFHFEVIKEEKWER